MGEKVRITRGLSLRGSLHDGGTTHVWAVTRARHNKNGSCNSTLATVTEGVGGSELKMEAEVTWPEGVVCGDWEVVR